MSAASSSRLTPLTDSRSATTWSWIADCASRLRSAWRASVPTRAVSWPRPSVSDCVPPSSTPFWSSAPSVRALPLSLDRGGVRARLKLSPAAGAPLSDSDQPEAGSAIVLPAVYGYGPAPLIV